MHRVRFLEMGPVGDLPLDRSPSATVAAERESARPGRIEGGQQHRA